jgi:uncharacterized protein (TIGR02453 family)
VRKEYLAFADTLIKIYERIDPDFHDMRPQDVIFRINRDTRFSKDKSPYKNWMSVYLAPSGKNRELIWPYIHMQPGNESFIGGGLWTPQPRVLRAFREYTSVHYKEFEQILSDKKLVKAFGKLHTQSIKTVPKWFAKDHPAIEILRYTSFTFQKSLTDAEVLSADFVDVCREAMKVQYEFNHYINRAIEEWRAVDDAEIFE